MKLQPSVLWRASRGDILSKCLSRGCKKRTTNRVRVSRTIVDIDDALMRKAKRLSGLTTKKKSLRSPCACSFKRILKSACGVFEARSSGKEILRSRDADEHFPRGHRSRYPKDRRLMSSAFHHILIVSPVTDPIAMPCNNLLRSRQRSVCPPPEVRAKILAEDRRIRSLKNQRRIGRIGR